MIWGGLIIPPNIIESENKMRLNNGMKINSWHSKTRDGITMVSVWHGEQTSLAITQYTPPNLIRAISRNGISFVKVLK